jgi:hypothetical protein
MKRSVTVAILFAAAVYAQTADDRKSAKPATAPQAVTIPKDAVKDARGVYTYTDKQGKKWIYRDSPFGVIRTVAPEPAAETRPNPNQAAAAIKVIDKGETVRFERPSPFGPVSWERKKSDLTDEERKVVDGQNQSKTETQPQTETQSGKPDAK